MVDFRYHIVSLIAVFLALGIGIVMGTTVIDRAIVTRLEGDIDRLSDKVEKEKSAKELAESELAQFNAFAEQGAKFFVANRLAGQTVTVLAADGVPDDEIEATVRIMRLAGAAVPAVVTYTNKFELGDQTARDQLALFTNAPNSELETVRQYSILNLAVKFGSAKLNADQQGIVTPEVQASLVGNLETDGFLTIEGKDIQQGLDPNTLGGQGTLAVVLGGGDVAEALMKTFYIPFTLQMASGGRSLAAEGTTGEQALVLAVRADPSASATMSTVDNINMAVGQFVAVIALEQELNGIYEHLGVGAGADRLLPERISS